MNEPQVPDWRTWIQQGTWLYFGMADDTEDIQEDSAIRLAPF
jgi:hypothetical protein